MQDLLRSLLRPTVAVLLSPLGLLLISATRLLMVADDRPATAVAIASSGGYVNTLLGTLIPIFPIFIPYIALVLLFFRRFILSAIAFLAAAFISPAQVHATRPVASYTAADIWHATLNWLNIHSLAAFALTILLFWILLSWLRDRWTQYQWLSIFWIIGAAFLFLPLITPIYSFPRALSFYVTELRQPWLSSEKITLKSGQNDYGYTLTTGDGWVEINGRKSHDTIHPRWRGGQPSSLSSSGGRFFSIDSAAEVCSGGVTTCPNKDGPPPPAAGTPIPRTRAKSYLSHGESLTVISSSTHVPPDQIISETNAYQHQRLSRALREYEVAGNWNAPTPCGQHFWYYPPVTP